MSFELSYTLHLKYEFFPLKNKNEKNWVGLGWTQSSMQACACTGLYWAPPTDAKSFWVNGDNSSNLRVLDNLKRRPFHKQYNKFNGSYINNINLINDCKQYDCWWLWLISISVCVSYKIPIAISLVIKKIITDGALDAN